MSDRTAPRHPIGVVARRTGLKPDLIRAWERRYSAVAPGRSDTRRRFYSDADIERLQLLRRAVRNGHGIGRIAGLPNEDLLALLAQDATGEATDSAGPGDSGDDVQDGGALGVPGDDDARLLDLCLSAARRLDVRELEVLLDRASVALSRNALLEQLLIPLLHRVGELWKEGVLRPSHEHMVSAVVRSFLGGIRSSHSGNGGGPQLVVTTPARQHHELGALIAAAVAASEGWQVTYLGPDLPPEEIAAAALQKNARAVALSITYPPDDPLLVDELRRLRRLLSPTIELVVGGRASAAYGRVLGEVGARHIDDLRGLRGALEALRTAPPEPAADGSGVQ
jgi:DNA-binding transcriptional MerR regulator/methylmalonyl-CoA mutase cobalamin-binding subunit